MSPGIYITYCIPFTRLNKWRSLTKRFRERLEKYFYKLLVIDIMYLGMEFIIVETINFQNFSLFCKPKLD